jgi:hypothetical protein
LRAALLTLFLLAPTLAFARADQPLDKMQCTTAATKLDWPNVVVRCRAVAGDYAAAAGAATGARRSTLLFLNGVTMIQVAIAYANLGDENSARQARVSARASLTRAREESSPGLTSIIDKLLDSSELH